MSRAPAMHRHGLTRSLNWREGMPNGPGSVGWKRQANGMAPKSNVLRGTSMQHVTHIRDASAPIVAAFERYLSCLLYSTISKSLERRSQKTGKRATPVVWAINYDIDRRCTAPAKTATGQVMKSTYLAFREGRTAQDHSLDCFERAG